MNRRHADLGLFELIAIALGGMIGGGIFAIFMVLNIVSVKMTGRVEDLLVYTKLVLLLVVMAVLFRSNGAPETLPTLQQGGSFSGLLVVASALLATSSAISGTLFGASRLMAVIADDGYLPQALSRRIHGHTPVWALVSLATMAFIVVATGGLELILEFGSLTFILVSFLVALANLRVREKTGASLLVCLASLMGLGSAGVLIVHYQLKTDPFHLAVTLTLYGIITLFSGLHARWVARPGRRS